MFRKESFKLNGLEVMKLSLQTKNEMVQFYLECSNRLVQVLSKEIIKKITDDESFHLQRIHEGYEQLKKGEMFGNEFRESLRKSSREYFETIFSEAIKNQTEELFVESPEIEIIDTALGLETKAHHFFITHSKGVEEGKIKEFLSFLASEEYRHYNLLYYTKEYLLDPQD